MPVDSMWRCGAVDKGDSGIVRTGNLQRSGVFDCSSLYDKNSLLICNQACSMQARSTCALSSSCEELVRPTAKFKASACIPSPPATTPALQQTCQEAALPVSTVVPEALLAQLDFVGAIQSRDFHNFSRLCAIPPIAQAYLNGFRRIQ